MKYKQLSREQRYAIYLGLIAKLTYTAIAKQINVSVSTVSREVRRNRNSHGHYLFKEAHELAMVRRERNVSKKKIDPYLLLEALALIKEHRWSPQQVSAYLRQRGKSISHERIYQAIRADRSLWQFTRHGMKYRRHIRRIRPTKATNIPNRVSIHERPAEADGKRFGDWELDLIIGGNRSGALVTLVERSTGYILLDYIPDKKPSTVASKVWALLVPFKGDSLKTITTDNGTEFRDHEVFAKKLGVDVYFADSYCSWQKGAIENANKLIREYFPKGSCFSLITKDMINFVRKELNQRPRAKLNFQTPAFCFYKQLP